MTPADRSSDLFEKMLLEDDDEERAMIRARYVGALRRESAEAVENIKRRGKTPPVSREQQPAAHRGRRIRSRERRQP